LILWEEEKRKDGVKAIILKNDIEFEAYIFYWAQYLHE